MIKKILLLYLFFLYNPAFSQQIITGKVIDAETEEPLAFANLILDKNTGSITNYDGTFEMSVPENLQSFSISYIGYQTKVQKIIPGQKKYIIALKPSAESLEAVVINAKNENPAVALMKKAIKQKKQNNYQKKPDKYAYTKYIKFIAGADTDKIDKEFDTIYKNGKIYKIDSTLYEFKKELSDKYMWMFESLIKINGRNGNEKAEIIATRTAGLKKPLYEFLALQVSGQNVYDDQYKFLFQSYLGPFAKASFKQYNYKIDDTLSLQKRPVIVVDYKNTKKPLISGKIYLDQKTLAIAKLTLNTYKEFQFNAVYNFKYYDQAGVWFPSDVQISVKKAENKKDINFGNTVAVHSTQRDTIINKEGDTLVQTRKKSELDYTYIRYQVKISDVKLGANYPLKIKYNLEIDPQAANRDEDFWQKYTRQQIDKKEKNTYKYIDSIAEKENIEQNIEKIRKLMYGYLPVHKYVDLDILHLLDYNRYEKFRLQLGGKTSEQFSGKWQIASYIAYGFGDKEWKYSGSLRYKLDHQTQTYLQVSYTKDLQKSGSFAPVGQENIFNLEHHYADDKFYMEQAYRFQISHLLLPALKINLNFTQGTNTTEFPIPYHYGRIEFQEKDIAYFQTQIEFTPFAKYTLMPEGRKLLKNGYPKFYVSFEKNLPGLNIDKTDYYRVDVQTLIKKTYLNKTYSELMLKWGWASKDAGINKLYQPVTNAYPADNPLKAVNLNRKFAFETMNDYEFVDNFLITGHLRHTFPRVKTGKHKSIGISLVGRFAYGLSYDSNTYTGIQSLDKVYYESGIEFQRLFGGMGLGFYYRFGEYAHPDKWDNLAIRLTLSPFKLF